MEPPSTAVHNSEQQLARNKKYVNQLTGWLQMFVLMLLVYYICWGSWLSSKVRVRCDDLTPPGSAGYPVVGARHRHPLHPGLLLVQYRGQAPSHSPRHSKSLYILVRLYLDIKLKLFYPSAPCVQ